MRRTKIVCTIGPATESLEMMEALIHAGMDVARLNFSHGSLEEHGARIERLRFLEKKLGKPIGILVDIQGPKIRLGELAEERPVLEKGERVYVTPDPSVKTAEDGRRVLPIIYPRLLEQIGPGQTIYLDDGLVELRVEAVDPAAGRALCTVVTGGELRSRKGVSLPEVDVDLPAIDGADEEHIRFAVEAGVDFVAASFVRRPEHVEAVREVIRAAGGTQQVIAKIESREGVRNLDAILEVADGIMVARGDMGVELPSEEVPLVQKRADRQGQPAGQTGDYGDADAGLHGPEPAAHPGRSDRRGQRHLRRDGRGDAFGRDGGGPLPRRGRANDGPDRPQERRGPGLRQVAGPAPHGGQPHGGRSHRPRHV